MHSRKKAPYTPEYARYLLRLNKVSQQKLATDLAITPGAVSRFLDGLAYSGRFWRHFNKVVATDSVKQAS